MNNNSQPFLSHQSDPPPMASPPPPSPLKRLSTFTSRTAATPHTDLDILLSSDPTFAPFLSPTFSPSAFSSSALSSGSAASSAEHLQSALRTLSSHLRSEILLRHSSLLSHLSSLSSLQSSLLPLRSSVSNLQSSVRRVRSEISDPRRQIAAHTRQLTNLHAATSLLQSSVRLLRLSRKLRDLMAVSPERLDLHKAAQLHCEILTLSEENGLGGIAAVDQELTWVFEAGATLRAEGMKVLETGLEGLNQAQVGAGLQVFYNLGELKTTVDGLINKYKSMGFKSISAALDMKAISASSGGGGYGPGGIQRSGTPQIGGGAKAKEALWQRMGACMDQLHSIVVAVWNLQRVLSKKRDPFTHMLLLDEVLQEGEPMLTDRVWEALVKSFSSQMKSTFTASSFVKEIFTVGYPKLYSMIENLLERITRDTDVKGVIPAISPDGKYNMLTAIETFQSAFLGLCLSRLSDLVNSVFPMSSRGSVPSKEHISRIISRIQEEIEAVQPNARLTLLVLHEINKVLILLSQKAEYQISAGPEARQITGPATPAQIKNFALCQHLQEIHAKISIMTNGLPTIASDVLSPALGNIYGVAYESIVSLFNTMLERLQSCILQIHDQNFGTIGMDSTMDNNSSPYMEELQKYILHFRKEFLSRLMPSSSNFTSLENICTRLARSMASRVLIFFIRHASLIRPLSESGKLKMARDMAELELAVGQNLFPVEQLGAPYRALRAFRPFIFLETSHLEGSPQIKDLPVSVILHHLYSRGPEELQSPMQRNRLTPIQYSLWMDSQGEDQIWKGIKATLDDYAVEIRSRGDKEFSPVYPLMLLLGSSLLEKTQKQKA